MAVPNTNTFSLRDVIAEIYNDGSDRDLLSLFTAATGTFDSNYVTNSDGYKNNLLNFRNYQHITYSYPIVSYYAVTIDGTFAVFHTSRASAEQALYDYFHPAGRTVTMNGMTLNWNTSTIAMGSRCAETLTDRWYVGTTLHVLYHIVNSVVTEVIVEA